jgi:hypothetical protein
MISQVDKGYTQEPKEKPQPLDVVCVHVREELRSTIGESRPLNNSSLGSLVKVRVYRDIPRQEEGRISKRIEKEGRESKYEDGNGGYSYRRLFIMPTKPRSVRPGMKRRIE